VTGSLALLLTVLLAAAPAPPPARQPAPKAARPPRPPAADPPEPAAPPSPGTTTDFGTWSVGCDNTLRCTAASHLEAGPGATWVVIRREGGPRAEPEILVAASGTAPAALAIDAATLPAARVKAGLSRATDYPLEPRATRPFLEKALAGKRLAALDRVGDVIGTVPLLDLPDALKAMDEAQHREGTVTALVAKGKRSAAAVPAPPPLPVVVARPLPAPRSEELSAEEVAALGAVSGCELKAEGGPASVAPLDEARVLVLVVCVRREVDALTVPVLLDRAGGTWHASLPAFDYPPPQRYGSGPALVDGFFDHQTATLRDGSPGGPKGQRLWAWDGAGFRLTSATAPAGGAEPISVWRAAVRPK